MSKQIHQEELGLKVVCSKLDRQPRKGRLFSLHYADPKDEMRDEALAATRPGLTLASLQFLLRTQWRNPMTSKDFGFSYLPVKHLGNDSEFELLLVAPTKLLISGHLAFC